MFDDAMAKTAHTQINLDGLTYRHKPGGSPFSGGSGLQGQAMSCFLCGRHRPRSMLKSRLLLGRHQAVCAPSCREAEAAGSGRVAEPAGAVERD